MNRFFVVNFFKNGSAIIEEKPQIHKIKNVLRLQKGDKLEIFDQYSKEYITEIEQITDSTIFLNILKQRKVNTPKYKINLAAAFPKGKRGDWIIEKVTELGVDSIFILETKRSVMDAGIGRINKWKQIAIQAAEQSGRVTVPIIERRKIEQINGIKIAAVINAKEHIKQKLEELQPKKDVDEITYFVGPEGDWTEQEIRQIEGLGAINVTLGSQILRVETASVVGIYSLGIWREHINQINQIKM